jgi:predicted Fe-S protein YdhL (DUF1289 family)
MAAEWALHRRSIGFINTITWRTGMRRAKVASPPLPPTTCLPAMSTASPCIDVCKFDSETGFCIGCLRTRDECKTWKKMKDKHRRKIIDDRSRRERKLNR